MKYGKLPESGLVVFRSTHHYRLPKRKIDRMDLSKFSLNAEYLPYKKSLGCDFSFDEF
jgi:hypothetical protein